MIHLALLALLSTSWAGKVYINGVRADSLRNTELKEVDVLIDANGDVQITAPHYNIEVVGEPAPEEGGGEPAKAVAQGIWWLVTQDNKSSGHQIDVYVGNAKVKTIRSGEPQVILDLAPYLVPGENMLSFTSKGGAVGGGVLQIYVGRASNQGGTLNMDTPQVEYSRRSTDSEQDLRTFVLKVD